MRINWRRSSFFALGTDTNLRIQKDGNSVNGVGPRRPLIEWSQSPTQSSEIAKVPVYLLIDIQVTDHDLYSEYVKQVPAIVKKYEGRYLARGGKVRVLSGEWRPERIILIEFPSTEKLQQWLNSPEYAALKPIRERSTRGQALIIEGIDV
jgi:uncharacterized protein (DUF1330 family)